MRTREERKRSLKEIKRVHLSIGFICLFIFGTFVANVVIAIRKPQHWWWAALDLPLFLGNFWFWLKGFGTLRDLEENHNVVNAWEHLILKSESEGEEWHKVQ